MASAFSTYCKLHRTSLLLVCAALPLYYGFAYHLDRANFPLLIGLFSLLLLLSYKLLQSEKWNYHFLLASGLAFRLVFLGAEPNLSQDFYRFIWDGALVRQLINPYLAVPNTLITQPDLAIANAQTLYQGMGELSARHFSNYPPLNQYFFGLSALLSGGRVLGAIIAMRILLILADLGILYFGRKLLRRLNRSPQLIFWYFLNPLVIVELCGNLHFEGAMLFFFTAALYLISVEKWRTAALAYALSIMVKLVPLLFLPLFLKHYGWKKSSGFYALAGLFALLTALPFYAPQLIGNYTQTIGLWFSNFEFNAGLYNAIKTIALQCGSKPWELIKTYGKITPWVTIALVLLFTYYQQNQKMTVLIASMLWVLVSYYFIAPTVHPWYLVFLVLLGAFSEYRFPLLWSATAVLSYFAYANAHFQEHLGLLALEYLPVYALLAYEIANRFRNKGVVA